MCLFGRNERRCRTIRPDNRAGGRRPGTAHRLGNGDEIMPEAPQLDDHREVAALVSDETHGGEGGLSRWRRARCPRAQRRRRHIAMWPGCLRVSGLGAQQESLAGKVHGASLPRQRTTAIPKPDQGIGPQLAGPTNSGALPRLTVSEEPDRCLERQFIGRFPSPCPCARTRNDATQRRGVFKVSGLITKDGHAILGLGGGSPSDASTRAGAETSLP